MLHLNGGYPSVGECARVVGLVVLSRVSSDNFKISIVNSFGRVFTSGTGSSILG